MAATLVGSTGLGLALQRDGRIVVAGGIQPGLVSSFLLARFLRTGAIDPSFGGHGYTVTDMRSAKRKDDKATALAIAPDGRLVSRVARRGTSSRAAAKTAESSTTLQSLASSPELVLGNPAAGEGQFLAIAVATEIKEGGP